MSSVASHGKLTPGQNQPGILSHRYYFSDSVLGLPNKQVNMTEEEKDTFELRMIYTLINDDEKVSDTFSVHDLNIQKTARLNAFPGDFSIFSEGTTLCKINDDQVDFIILQPTSDIVYMFCLPRESQNLVVQILNLAHSHEKIATKCSTTTFQYIFILPCSHYNLEQIKGLQLLANQQCYVMYLSDNLAQFVNNFPRVTGDIVEALLSMCERQCGEREGVCEFYCITKKKIEELRVKRKNIEDP